MQIFIAGIAHTRNGTCGCRKGQTSILAFGLAEYAKEMQAIEECTHEIMVRSDQHSYDKDVSDDESDDEAPANWGYSSRIFVIIKEIVKSLRLIALQPFRVSCHACICRHQMDQLA